MWHWASALDLPICPPASSSLKIGHWLQDDLKVDERQRWIKAYTCSLQCMAEASVGWFWTTEARTMTLEVSNLVQTFLTTTSTCISPHIVRECWPLCNQSDLLIQYIQYFSIYPVFIRSGPVHSLQIMMSTSLIYFIILCFGVISVVKCLFAMSNVKG